MPSEVPSPLPPWSSKLARSRVHVFISDPHPTRPGRKVVREGRFVTMKAARTWAEAERKPGQHANLTTYAASDGWLSHAAGRLTDSGWEDR